IRNNIEGLLDGVSNCCNPQNNKNKEERCLMGFCFYELYDRINCQGGAHYLITLDGIDLFLSHSIHNLFCSLYIKNK
ncbi:hypothetical protein ACJX0J_018912, partial [Zea mays]